MLTFNNALLPWWSPSNFKFLFVCLFDDVFGSIHVTITFPHHCRPNLSLAVPLEPSMLAKLPRVLSRGSATPLPVGVGTGPGDRPHGAMPGSTTKGWAAPRLLGSPPSPERQREAEACGAWAQKGWHGTGGQGDQRQVYCKGSRGIGLVRPSTLHIPWPGSCWRWARGKGNRGWAVTRSSWERDIRARGRAKGGLRWCSRAGFRKATVFLKKRLQRSLQSWFSGASLSNAVYGVCSHYLPISKRRSYFLR